MRISKVLLLLASATLALAQQAVVSKGILIGEDKTDKNAKGAEIYKNPQNHQSAAASIIAGVAKIQGYEPYALDPTESSKVFGRFERQFRRLPGFHAGQQDEIVLRLTSDLNQIERAIKEAYPDIGSVSIAKALRELVPSSTKHPQAKYWVLSVVAIDMDPLGIVDAKLFALFIQLNVDGDGKVTLPSEQTSYLNIANIEVDTDYMTAHADELFARFEVATTHEFEVYFTSPEEDVLTQWLHPDTGRQSVLDF
ncbi:hypothetical protein DFQ27_003237 [Actinomortierella ambigua]|uniref:Uncharacterized protein n=1 Tax=Actinomortierella ambigua TaxID=1343610 RepID=A0A9P6U5Y4_9FUNG|nr:hypothetical protein DFQ27_003237 [Actinomortierella ambigua]